MWRDKNRLGVAKLRMRFTSGDFFLLGNSVVIYCTARVNLSLSLLEQIRRNNAKEQGHTERKEKEPNQQFG